VPVSRVYREFDALQADDRSAFGHEGGPMELVLALSSALLRGR
jgi:hypothetical protein